MAQVVQLTFANAQNNTMTVSIENPKANITEAEINAVMQTIIDQAIFAKEGVVFNIKKAARIVERNVTDFELTV